jgi:hypothetical protein
VYIAVNIAQGIFRLVQYGITVPYVHVRADEASENKPLLKVVACAMYVMYLCMHVYMFAYNGCYSDCGLLYNLFWMM